MTATEMMIDSVSVALVNYQRALILKAKETEKYLPVWIGASEADAIAATLHDVQFSRPLTHDFLCSVIETLGATVKSIIIDKLVDNAFHAKVVLVTDKGKIDMDCRPSDAVAVAVRTKAPIFVDDEVLDRAGIETKTDK